MTGFEQFVIAVIVGAMVTFMLVVGTLSRRKPGARYYSDRGAPAE
ncbi:MAG: hypothetical protein AB7N54_14095 [Alphaproteobacteria bacterium]